MKVFKNVLISSGKNDLQLVDFYFKEKIWKTERRLSHIIKWENIADKESWQKFQNEIPEKEYPPELKILDGNFFVLIPGAIDAHVHFDTPGFEDRDNFDFGSLAAAYGGVTTVIDMPDTSIPPVTNAGYLEIKKKAVQNRSCIDYAFWGGISGNDFDEEKDIRNQIKELAESGVVGFKAYYISGMETFTDLNHDQMQKAADWVKTTGLPLAVHAEDKDLIEKRRSQLKKIGNKSWQAYYFARDERAEALAIINLINIARKTGCRIHIVHMSSEFGTNLVHQAQSEGLRVTAETCPHYLHFTREDFENPEICNYLKTAPPVKTEFDRNALWEGLKNRTISFVTTDHAGCDPEKEKKSSDFWQVYGGIPGVEHRVPYMFSEGFLKGKLNLEETIDVLSTNPARYFNLGKSKGSLNWRNDADFALINLWDEQVISAKDMHSKGHYTPFEGLKLNAVVERTFVRGKLVAHRNKKMKSNFEHGRFIPCDISNLLI